MLNLISLINNNYNVLKKKRKFRVNRIFCIKKKNFYSLRSSRFVIHYAHNHGAIKVIIHNLSRLYKTMEEC